MHQGQTSEEAQGKQSVSHSHINVKNVKDAGMGDNHKIGVICSYSSIFSIMSRFAVKQKIMVIILQPNLQLNHNKSIKKDEL